MHSLYSNYLCRAPDIAAVGTILTSLVMTQSWTEIKTYHLPDDEQMRYVLSHGRGLFFKHSFPIIRVWPYVHLSVRDADWEMCVNCYVR